MEHSPRCSAGQFSAGSSVADDSTEGKEYGIIMGQVSLAASNVSLRCRTVTTDSGIGFST